MKTKSLNQWSFLQKQAEAIRYRTDLSTEIATSQKSRKKEQDVSDQRHLAYRHQRQTREQLHFNDIFCRCVFVFALSVLAMCLCMGVFVFACVCVPGFYVRLCLCLLCLLCLL